MRLCSTIAVLLIIHGAYAQLIFTPATQKPSIVANPIESMLKLDGKLNEPAWSQSKAISAFVQVEPRQGNPSDYPSEVKVLYTKRYLYIGVYCAEPSGIGGLRAPDLKRDFNWRAHDTFAICIDGFNDERNSITVATNPYGAQKDYLSFDATFFDSDWNGLWSVRTSRTDSSWTAEFEIPWKTLRYPDQQDSLRSWGINFLRLRRYSNEISAWSSYPRSFSFNRMEYAGRLDSLVVPPPAANLQVTPYFLTTAHDRKGSGTGDGTDTQVKMGGELKWAINANTVLDLTANTDFAQADADVQVNNVSRFSVLFPERRSFFLENASLFGAGLSPLDGIGGRMNILPFFSRQIGLTSGTPIPIDGGARIVRRGLKNNYGAILMRQRSTGATAAANFFAGRFSQNIGAQSRIGVMATAKNVQATDSTNGYTNIISAVDGFFRLDNINTINSMLMMSNTAGAKGYAGFAQYLYTTNAIQGWWTQSFVTDNFDPQVGFVSRKDVLATTPGLTTSLRGNWLPLKKIIRAFKPGASAEFYHQLSTQTLTEREIKITPLGFDLQSGGYISYAVAATYQKLSTPFAPLSLVIATGSYSFTRNMIQSGSDASRKISYTFLYEWGNYFDGTLRSTDLALAFAPIPHISLRASLNHNNFENIGEASVSGTATLYTLEGRFALNPRLQLVGLYQKNTVDKLDAANVRLAWEYRPLSYIYVVLNSRAYTAMSRQHEQTGIFKVTYLKQF